jgi:hypothetical protein
MTSNKDMLRCAKRELALRERVYPRFVEQGKMSTPQAVMETKTMQEIVNHFQKLVDDETPGFLLGGG